MAVYAEVLQQLRYYLNAVPGFGQVFDLSKFGSSRFGDEKVDVSTIW
jgi:hypothetical protein